MDKLADKFYPKLPGVYLMKNAEGKVIYVGKAKNLKKRLNDYFQQRDDRIQIQFLLNKIADIETIVTGTEEQALILERDLINRYKPKYNIRLKDDKAYLSIRINYNSEYPRLELTRRVFDDGSKYWGPYANNYEVREIMELINRLIPLRTCSDNILKNRTRPCIEYEIKRCLAPCCLDVDKINYNEYLKKAERILNGKIDFIEDELNKLMENSSNNLFFEDAALYRDKLEVVKNFKTANKYISNNTENKDVFAIYRESSLCCLSIMNVVNGRIANNKNYSFEQVIESDEDIILSALYQYYEDQTKLPNMIILPMEINYQKVLKEFFKKRGNLPEITIPKIGLNFRLLKLAEINAKQFFNSKFNEEELYFSLASELKSLANLSSIPRTIECIDISNLQGSDIVGAIVNFKDGIPDKNQYRKYLINGLDAPNDFASIKQVLSRRLNYDNLPDLFLIDGGSPQLRAAHSILEELNCNIPCIAIAKERDSFQERIIVDPKEEPVILELDKGLGKLLVKIRDEVHRYVITFHKSRRSKRVISSKLDQVFSLEIRNKLLKEYGTISEILKIEHEELARFLKIPKNRIKTILDKLNNI